jgi:hypothetical protein
MIGGLAPEALVAAIIVASFALPIGGVAGWLWGRWTAPDELPEFEQEVLDRTGPVELQQPDLKSGTFGVLGQVFALREWLRKRRKLLNSGHVQWFLVEDGWPTAKYVKPQRKNGGTPECEHQGTTYLFPKNAAVPDEVGGILTFVHTEGDSQPIHVRDPDRPALAPDAVKALFDRRVTTDEPSLFDRLDLDLDARTIMAGGLALTMVGSVVVGAI